VGGLVVIEGASGLGKTSLLRAAAVEGQRRGFEVARARGAQLEREWPLGIARQLLEPVLRRCLADERAGLLDGAATLAAHVVLPKLAAGAGAVDASFGTLHGLYWLCANLATRRPLLLVVDDAQWADEMSLRFLGVLARRLDALPAVVLLAQRPLPPDALAELSADPQSDVLELRRLSCAATLALLSQWSPDAVDVGEHDRGRTVDAFRCLATFYGFQNAPSHHLCKRELPVPRTKMSVRSNTRDTTAGSDVKVPPRSSSLLHTPDHRRRHRC
jgi:hypothetical protein